MDLGQVSSQKSAESSDNLPVVDSVLKDGSSNDSQDISEESKADSAPSFSKSHEENERKLGGKGSFLNHKMDISSHGSNSIGLHISEHPVNYNIFDESPTQEPDIIGMTALTPVEDPNRYIMDLGQVSSQKSAESSDNLPVVDSVLKDGSSNDSQDSSEESKANKSRNSNSSENSDINNNLKTMECFEVKRDSIKFEEATVYQSSNGGSSSKDEEVSKYSNKCSNSSKEEHEIVPSTSDSTTSYEGQNDTLQTSPLLLNFDVVSVDSENDNGVTTQNRTSHDIGTQNETLQTSPLLLNFDVFSVDSDNANEINAQNRTSNDRHQVFAASDSNNFDENQNETLQSSPLLLNFDDFSVDSDNANEVNAQSRNSNDKDKIPIIPVPSSLSLPPKKENVSNDLPNNLNHPPSLLDVRDSEIVDDSSEEKIRGLSIQPERRDVYHLLTDDQSSDDVEKYEDQFGALPLVDYSRSDDNSEDATRTMTELSRTEDALVGSDRDIDRTGGRFDNMNAAKDLDGNDEEMIQRRPLSPKINDSPDKVESDGDRSEEKWDNMVAVKHSQHLDESDEDEISKSPLISNVDDFSVEAESDGDRSEKKLNNIVAVKDSQHLDDSDEDEISKMPLISNVDDFSVEAVSDRDRSEENLGNVNAPKESESLSENDEDEISKMPLLPTTYGVSVESDSGDDRSEERLSNVDAVKDREYLDESDEDEISKMSLSSKIEDISINSERDPDRSDKIGELNAVEASGSIDEDNKDEKARISLQQSIEGISSSSASDDYFDRSRERFSSAAVNKYDDNSDDSDDDISPTMPLISSGTRAGKGFDDSIDEGSPTVPLLSKIEEVSIEESDNDSRSTDQGGPRIEYKKTSSTNSQGLGLALPFVYEKQQEDDDEDLEKAFVQNNGKPDDVDSDDTTKKNQRSVFIIFGVITLFIFSVTLIVGLMSRKEASKPLLRNPTVTTSSSAPSMKPSNRPSSSPTTIPSLPQSKLSIDKWTKIASVSVDPIHDLSSIAMSSTRNGYRLAVGAREYSDEARTLRIGIVRVYDLIDTRGNISWDEILVLTGEYQDDEFGYSVSMSNDGSLLVVGAPGYDILPGSDTNEGRIYLYDLSKFDPIAIEASSTTIDGETYGEEFGYSCFITQYVLAVGSPARGGAVRLYQRTNNDSSNLEYTISQMIPGATDSFHGASLSLSSNGVQLLIGDPYSGYVEVWVKNQINLRWYRDGRLSNPITDEMDGVSSSGSFGKSITQSDDGSKILVGSPTFGSFRGAARLFKKENGIWVEEKSVIGTGSKLLGDSVAMSSDGNVLFIGAPNSGNGTVIVLRRYAKTGEWTQSNIDGESIKDQGSFGGFVASGDDNTIFSIASPDLGITSTYLRNEFQ